MGCKGNRRGRVPVAKAFVGVRNRNQEGEGACCTGFSVCGGEVGCSKGNPEGEGLTQ